MSNNRGPHNDKRITTNQQQPKKPKNNKQTKNSNKKPHNESPANLLSLGIDAINKTILITKENCIELKETSLFLSASNKVTLKEMQSLSDF